MATVCVMMAVITHFTILSRDLWQTAQDPLPMTLMPQANDATGDRKFGSHPNSKPEPIFMWIDFTISILGYCIPRGGDKNAESFCFPPFSHKNTPKGLA